MTLQEPELEVVPLNTANDPIKSRRKGAGGMIAAQKDNFLASDEEANSEELP